MITAQIIKDSISPAGIRLTTFVLTYPRFLHSEFMTHRVFSRNASSSRALPLKKQIQEVLENPATPLKFLANRPGMQGGEPIADQRAALASWLKARDQAVEQARVLADLNIHKQYSNRILEPFSHITVVCSATSYANFFALRYHPDAQPEICQLAKQMWHSYLSSNPTFLEPGEWHLPFVNEDVILDTRVDLQQNNRYGETLNALLIKRSVAKCARVSYKNHDGTETSVEQDLALYSRLLQNTVIHASPAEHQAMSLSSESFDAEQKFFGNFYGWRQYRKTLPNENIETFNGPLA